MTQTWYFVQWGEITPVQVSKATEQSVYTVDATHGERRNAKSSQWGDYYHTRTEAVASLVRKYRQGIEQARRSIEQGQANLQRLAQEYPAEYAAAEQAKEAQ